MIPQAHITAWRATAPWADDAQVEQDLVLSRAVVELFTGAGLDKKLALRGGTSLNKLFVAPGVRYSEDIDLVQTQAAPIGPIINAIRGRLDAWLGKPLRKASEGGVSLVYRFDLWLCLERKLVDPGRVIACFLKYMQHEGHAVSRAEFEANLFEKENNPEFMGDIAPLLSPDVKYDSAAGLKLVRDLLIARLPDDPWRGVPSLI